ncbi:hypothetical protein FRC07_007144 [Ceratobasidium sp. 392]|nr:hypothetical protein FRC07_007144 [Ceratobasidium sp. 392]
MPGFNVSVFDDVSGAPIPQVDASDGGGLVNGKVFSAPNIIWAIAAALIGLPMGIAGVRLWRVTTALGGGLLFAFAMWTALINTLTEAGLASTQFMSDMLILLITGAAFLLGTLGGAFRIAIFPAMGATCAIGGVSITSRIIILRPGLLIPSGLDTQLAFANLVIVIVGMLCGGLSVVFAQRSSMIFATASAGSFLIALTIDLFVNGQNGMSRGLRSLFDKNNNHLATFLSQLVVTEIVPHTPKSFTSYTTSRICPIFYLFQHYTFPGPFVQPRARDRTQSIAEPLSNEKPSPSFNQGPTIRNSVLSIFRVPSKITSGQASMNWTGGGIFGRSAPAKPANERRGSEAYNYGTGAFTLPSELLRQESRRKAQPPPSRQVQFSTPRRDGRPGGVQQPLPASNEGYSQARGYLYAPGSGPGLGPPVGIARTNPTNGPDPGAVGRVANAPVQTRYPDPSLLAPIRPNMRNGRAPLGGPALPSSPRAPHPALLPPPQARYQGSNFEPSPSPRTGIGMGMLRLSADSIIDAYGGTMDTGYRYGGSKSGQEVSPYWLAYNIRPSARANATNKNRF